MTQVTDEDVRAALEAHANAPTIVDEVTAEEAMRAALEAALAVREKNSDCLTDDQIAYCHERADNRRAEWRNDLVGRLRRQSPAFDIVAADLIERQAEEIAQLKDFTVSLENQGDSLSAEVKRLTAERAELTEALRPKATTKRQAKVSQDNEIELRRWCVEMAIRWPVQGGSGGFASGSYIPTVAVDADVLGRAKKLLEWIKAR